MTFKFYDRSYAVLKRKDTGNYGVFKLNPKSNKWELEKEFPSSQFPEVKKYLKRLKDLAEKRECRHMIADMSGTSYRAAMEDMGMSKF